MTLRSAAAIACPMLRHAWLLILCLLASSLLATASVHAQEAYGAMDVSCAGETHSEGDADQSPPDGDQPVPHHHGACHGHNLTAPVASPALTRLTVARETPDATRTSRLAAYMTGPALEPPRG
jgi:hypothetical protein